MTTYVVDVPDSRPARIEHPQGTPAGVEDFAETLFRVRARYDDLAENEPAMRLDWMGQAGERYYDTLQQLTGQASTMAAGIRVVARAATAYGETLTELKQRGRDLAERKRSLDDQADSLRQQVRQVVDPDDAWYFGMLRACQGLAMSYGQLETDHDTLQADVAANDEAFIAVLSGNRTLADVIEGGADDTAVENALARPGAPGSGADAAATRRWWDALSAAEQAAVLAARPDLLGGADGLPAGVRDAANRVLLAEDLATLEAKEASGELDGDERDRLRNVRAVRDALEDADGFHDPVTGELTGGQLWMYDPDKWDTENGAVAIAVGDLDTADRLAVRVPGITNEIVDAPALTAEAYNLYEGARNLGDGDSVASMMWLGYDTPDAFWDPDTVSNDRAREGGAALADSVSGLKAGAEHDQAVTVIGHSYGSTTVAHAASDHTMDVEDVVLVGSPGGGDGNSAADLRVGTDHVWAGRASRDIVPTTADHGWVGAPNLGRDPAEDKFGAQRFQAESVERTDGHRGIADHGRYFARNSESLWNISHIVNGDYEPVRDSLAEPVHDPFFGGPEDPEVDRDPTVKPTTRQPGQW
ncbi:alpha/beta hydrolase [Nocardioides scoriae]|uniref:alpha/beta hydrolase n=1 Tax=Nocardioides scoriae TaxID=642780 RepID=UPI0012FCC3D6|nr:alpha/beta hydrolase [Nocardioides scoriae]